MNVMHKCKRCAKIVMCQSRLELTWTCKDCANLENLEKRDINTCIAECAECGLRRYKNEVKKIKISRFCQIHRKILKEILKERRIKDGFQAMV